MAGSSIIYKVHLKIHCGSLASIISSHVTIRMFLLLLKQTFASYIVDQFALYARATHVCSEAERVWQFKATCDAGGADCLQQLGALMFASHASCRDMYECSCNELDQLVELAR